jgi:hypothetical protein
MFLIMTGLDLVIFTTAQKEDARGKRGHYENNLEKDYPNFRCRRSCIG